jgi:hypothetical protein
MRGQRNRDESPCPQFADSFLDIRHTMIARRGGLQLNGCDGRCLVLGRNESEARCVCLSAFTLLLMHHSIHTYDYKTSICNAEVEADALCRLNALLDQENGQIGLRATRRKTLVTYPFPLVIGQTWIFCFGRLQSAMRTFLGKVRHFIAVPCAFLEERLIFSASFR